MYPPARRAPLVDTIHGVSVPDPYRWLEDAASPETRAWVDAQNALTRARLDGPAREGLVRRLTALYDYPRTLTFLRRGSTYFYTHNPGLLDQPVLYTRMAEDVEPRVLMDPNRLSADGTTALTAFEVSPDGTRVAYALSEHGSDRQVIRVLHVSAAKRQDVAEASVASVASEGGLEFVKFASIAWLPDASGFYYLRFPAPGEVAQEDEQYFGRIYFHRLGDPQGADPLVFAHAEREVVPLVAVSHTGRWVVITAQRGASDDSDVYVIARPPKREARRGEGREATGLVRGFDAAYQFVEEANGRLLFRTTKDAPMGRIVSIDPRNPSDVREVVAESGDRLSGAVMARDRIVASYLHDASDRLRVFTLDGTPSGEIALPGIGSLLHLDAQPDDDEIRFVFQTFTEPPSAHSACSFRLKAEATKPPRSFRLQAEYETHQVWYPSKDGTRVSMFLVHKKDLPKDGDRPVLLSGYGGFNISRTPAYDPGNFPFLDAGGIFALANLRGGGEYGEAWHRAGMLEKKQNVFDDFIAAAQHLITEGYTTPPRIAIEGGSNGGLLVGAVMLQRPDLFGAVVCRVPVADMLRYHLFTVGRFWIPEYGSADDSAQFRFLLEYSPYHNIRRGVRYPPALVMTADTDDRVDPGMAKKFAARLQAEGEGGPFLIRIEMKAGHGAGKPIHKIIEEDADILAFLTSAITAP